MDYELIYPEDTDNARAFRLREVRAIMDKSYDRKVDEDLEGLVETEKRLLTEKTSSILFNGAKFRFAGLTFHENQLVIKLGLTDYFEYLCTNHCERLLNALVGAGIRKHGDPDAFLSNALGNVAVVTSTDSKVVFLRRSENVHTFVGYYDLPGGHPEPSRLGSTIVPADGVANELFGSIREELKEELNVTDSDVIEVLNIGFLRSFEDGRKPEMLFHVPLNLSSLELAERFNAKRGTLPEGNEMYFANVDDVKHVNIKMTAVARGTVALYDKIRS